MSLDQTTATTPRIHSLDYLRGGAALAVVLFHFGFKGRTLSRMQGADFGFFSVLAGYGYLGVNLFFVISGFVIAMSAQSRNWQTFAMSRMTRLLPSMWICASITAIFLWLYGPPNSISWVNYFASLTLVPGWFGQPGVDSAYWSLRVEVQFYLAVCLLLAISKLQWTPKIVFVWMLASTVNLIKPWWRADFLFVLSWAPYFVVGIILYSWRHSGKSAQNQLGLLWASFLCLAYAYKSAVKDGYEVPWVSCTLVLLIIVLFTYISLKPAQTSMTKPSFLLRSGLLLGGMSYPLYLIHQEFGYTLFDLLTKLFLDANSGATVPLMSVFTASLVITISVVVLLAWIIYRWPERAFTKTLKNYLDRSKMKHHV